MAQTQDKSDASPDAPVRTPMAIAAEPMGERCVWPHQTPAMRWLREGFVQRLLGQLPGLAGGQWHLRLAGVSLTALPQFVASVEEKTCCYGIKPAEDGRQATQTGWIEITPSIAFPILNCLLGGSSGDRFIPRRPLTAIERRLLLRVAQGAIQALRAVWPQPAAPPLDADGEAVLPAPAQAPRDPMVLSASFDFALDRQAGTLRICLGADLLPAMASPLPTAGQRESVLEITAVLPESGISARELAGLKPGDILMTNEPVDGEVVIRVAGIPKFIGKLGTLNGRRAVTIVRRIS